MKNLCAFVVNLIYAEFDLHYSLNKSLRLIYSGEVEGICLLV